MILKYSIELNKRDIIVKKRNLITILVAVVLMFSSLSVVSGAESYVNLSDEDALLESGVQPLYDIIHMISMKPFEDGVEATIETDWSAALQITITIYQQNGSGWSMKSKKSFSKNGTGLAVFLDYDFEPGVTYRAVVNFRAGSETDSMEDIFSF